MDSALLFTLATIAYLIAMVLYISFLVVRKDVIGKTASYITYAGLGVQTAALAMRWMESYRLGIGRAPLSNLYESLVFFTWSTVLIYVILEWKLRTRAFGAFVMPLAFLALAFINVAGISTEITPLVPALKSNWLLYHVFLSFIGYAAFAVAFGISMLYLLMDSGERGPATYRYAALGAFALLTVLGYALSSAGLKVQFWLGFGALLLAWFVYLVFRGAKDKPQIYLFLSICATVAVGLLVFMGIDYALFSMQQSDALAQEGFKKHLFESTFLSATVPVAALSWLSIAALFWLVWTKGSSVRDALRPYVPKLELLDDITYRMIAIGWPLFTAGGLVMGAVWANSAWGTYWSWDPKETWSLITWFIYSLYLHARYMRGWKGTQMAVISAVGFLAVIFTYLGVNLVLSGLHSYGGM
jgi:cytochrome c-type biogenesis protein CcsB